MPSLAEIVDLPPKLGTAAYLLDLELAEVRRRIEAAHRKLIEMSTIDSAAWTGRGWEETCRRKEMSG